MYAKNNILRRNKLFENKKFEEAKFKFEKDIVFNPKSEIIFILSKIFKKEKKIRRNNLKYSILLNPKNEEAIYNLAKY